MARKIIGYYNDAAQPRISDADQLTIEIGDDEMVCLVKGAESGEIEAFEMFNPEKGNSDWNDVFYEVKSASQLLNHSYRNIYCYYNFEEAVLIPEKKFSASAAEDYLSLLFGESERHDHKNYILNNGMVNAYRIRKSVNELVGRHFLLHKPNHVYSQIVEDLLLRNEPDDQFMKVQFYTNHMIVAVVKNSKLQLVQSFRFTNTEDILYHLLNTARQFAFDASRSHLEISGMFENGSALHQQLQSLFGLISFDSPKTTGVLQSATGYPAYYFTPFYKLVV